VQGGPPNGAGGGGGGADDELDDLTLVDPPAAMEDEPTMAPVPNDTTQVTRMLDGAASPGPPSARRAPPAQPLRPAAPAVGAVELAGGKYALDVPIGTGASGTVYRAHHRDLGRAIAIKILHDTRQQDRQFVKRFQREALAASKLDHRNVLRVLDFGQEPDGNLYIAMELVEGRSLQTVLAESGALPTSRIVDIMMQVCAALAVAHERGVIHRDIKPANIMLSPGFDEEGNAVETVKVCDFGVAYDAARSSDDTNTTVMVPGTPEYISPEQARGADPDHRSDLYSCGVVMYEMATGRLPFVADNPIALLMHHTGTEPENPRRVNYAVDVGIEHVILQCLRKSAAERYATARDLRAALKALKR
jgi:serine/threonine-protein kinase